MKRLFLASSGLEAIKDFVGKEPSTMKMLFITTAGNPYRNIWWIDKDRAILKKYGFNIIEFDIESATSDEIKSILNDIDIIYFAGGNTFHLLKQIQMKGFDKLVKLFVDNGGLYAGASAGALIAGPEIEVARDFDDPDNDIKIKTTKALNFVDFIPYPHYDMEGRTDIIDEIIKKYSKKHKIITLTDDQAVVVNGGSIKVVDSIRSEEELNWPQE